MDCKLPEHITSGTKEIERLLPEKLDLDILQDEVDIVLYRGLKQMSKLITGAKEEKSRISAFNVMISLGRYLETRNENAKGGLNGLVNDLDGDLFNDREVLNGKV